MNFLRPGPGRTQAAGLFIATALLAISAAAESDRGVPVRIEQVSEQPIQRIVELTGTVTSARSARLSTATSGLVIALHVDAGSQVQATDVLLELDPALAQWQWQSAQASAEATRIALADSQRRLEEARSLSPQMSIAESVVRDLEAEVAQDAADLKRVEAESGYRKGILERHQLRAPFAGVVSAKQTELGEWVDPGEPVLTLVSTQELRLDFPVSEDYLADVARSTPVTYMLGDTAGTPRKGKIATVVPITDPGARTFLLRVQPAEPDPRMTPGISASAQLTLDAGRRGLTVPRDAILKFLDGRVVVWVIDNSDGEPVVRETLVTTGVVFDGKVEIREGLDAGARVVVQGNEALRNGQRVFLLSAQPG